MELKPCTLPLIIPKLEAAIRDLPSDHPTLPAILQEFSNQMRGYQGQKSLVFYLKQLDMKKYDIIHDLRLFDGEYYFQMDILILCTSFFLVLEVKNRGGEIIFEKNFDQTTLKQNNKRTRIKNPVLQAKTQAKKLRKWLQDRNHPVPPIMYLFVNSKEETVIITDTNNYEINRNICNSEGLLGKIELIENSCQERMEPKDLRKITRLLLANHVPDDPDILEKFKISPKDLLPGVRCPNCHTRPMIYQRGFWYCRDCGKKFKDAHVQRINDHFLLIKPTITNVELRALLNISSRRVAYTILTSMDISFSGTNKGRVYYAPTSPSILRNPANLPLNKAPCTK
ncbi:nuclease-related domain-containing protein [Neobacillus niacini]|uniref:nuclease-related domain-containing protein n=1 Tax=Neobacillus niacini TaxID=86668 RepID=UPI00285C4ABE|nr:nuclease-related domain-containing protein [Neobacillus niacini]MDR6999338.1 DNA-directed RNA polymerase subunit RPC12/RpoP [Neobacillus niacini]